MFTSISNKINLFLHKSPRNKLIISKLFLGNDLFFVDVGVELSKIIESRATHQQISLVAYDALEMIMQNNEKTHPAIGKYTAILNLGILFQSAVKIDLFSFLERYSQNQSLIVAWEGEIDKNTLYFLSKTKGIQVDLTGISHLII